MTSSCCAGRASPVARFSGSTAAAKPPRPARRRTSYSKSGAIGAETKIGLGCGRVDADRGTERDDGGGRGGGGRGRRGRRGRGDGKKQGPSRVDRSRETAKSPCWPFLLWCNLSQPLEWKWKAKEGTRSRRTRAIEKEEEVEGDGEGERASEWASETTEPRKTQERMKNCH